MTPIDLTLLHDQLLAAIREDVGSGDITTRSTIPERARAIARYVTKQPLVVAGLPVVERLARIVDPALEFRFLAADRDEVGEAAPLGLLRGSARSILIVERVSLNLLQRMCGIATLTRSYVDRIRETGARVVDTRKTAPGLRILD